MVTTKITAREGIKSRREWAAKAAGPTGRVQLYRDPPGRERTVGGGGLLEKYRAARNSVIMRATMKIEGSLPDVNDPEDDVGVFSSEVGHLDCVTSGVEQFGGDADMELYTNGQNWLNTAVSKNYKEDKENIKEEEVKVTTYNKKTGGNIGNQAKCGVIENGNHRTIWSFYHKQGVTITPNPQLSGGLSGTKRKARFDDMVYGTK